MKKWKIVADTGADIRSLDILSDDIAYDIVPLMINIEDEVFVDNQDLDIPSFLKKLKETKSKTSSACASPEVYAQHFQDAENVICFTISAELSGSYNSASVAKDMALEENPDAKIHVYNSKSAGAEMDLLILKAYELVQTDITFDDLVEALQEYHDNLDIAFLLESVDNLVNNGRVSKIVGQMIGLLGIRLVGNRTPEGTIQLAHKSKGQKRGLRTLMNELKSKGYKGGKVYIAHVFNNDIANAFEAEVLKEFPNADISITTTSALCSYYAEHNGMIVGYETN